MLELKPEQLAQIRADIAARKAMPDYGQSVAGNMERLRVIADTRETFSTEAVEMLVKALDELVAKAKPVAEVRLVDEFCGCCQRPDVEWLGMAGDQFPVGTKFYTAQPAPAVPEEATTKNVERLAHSHLDTYQLDEDEANLAADIWNACRAAMLAQPVSGGYKLVPVEATEDMIAAAMNCDDVSFNADETFCVNFGNIYAAMLAAAPEEK
ncbi:hypothetical protein [Serratia sp. CY66712]|uniref:hypothetical protein n=1 Tax=Serratia sp. CY66712 TaxID=3383659 RepID=UPI003F9FC044